MPSSIPARRINTNQPRASTSAHTSAASTGQALVQPQTSKSTSTLPRRTTSHPKPTRSTTRVLATPHVGDHVILENGLKGTLRYQGETSFKKGIWAGIELDKPGTAQKVQLLERKKLSPSSSEPKTASPPTARTLALQDKLGNKPSNLDIAKPPHIELADLQEALAAALEENAALKDNQDEVVRLEKLLTSERQQSKSLRLEIDHIKRIHATHRKEQKEELHHLTASIHELEVVNKVLNSTLTELSSQTLPKSTGSDHYLIERDTQMKDLHAECKMLSQQLQVEKEKHGVTRMQLDTYGKDQSLAAETVQVTLKAYRERLQETQEKLDKTLLDMSSLMLEKEKLHAALLTSTAGHQAQESLYNETQVRQLTRELRDKQMENDQLSFTIQELKIALDKFKQDQVDQSLDIRHNQLKETLEEKRVETEKLKLNLADAQITVSEKQRLIDEFDKLKRGHQESTAALKLHVQNLEEDLLRLEQERNSAVEQLRKHNSLLKDTNERQYIIDQLLGDISELQCQLSEHRNQIDAQLEEIGQLSLEKEAKDSHNIRLQETNKQLETECLKLMDELLTYSVEGTNSTKKAFETPSCALHLSHQRTKQLETKLAHMQAELTSQLDRLSKEHTKVIKDKDTTIANLSKELSEIEHIVENKIFREAELEEQLGVEQRRKIRLQQEISDLQVSQYIPYSPESDYDNERAYGDIADASNYATAQAHNELYCGICDKYGHDTIKCKMFEPNTLNSLSQTTSEIQYNLPQCDYCEVSAEVPHWTEDCPRQQESY
ncbi:hypothetical protein VKS41_006746 [Umbelopsis sp. WA50703]